MKQFKFLLISGIACMFLFSSCGGSEEKTTDTTTTVDSTVTEATPSPTPTSKVDTTPQALIIVWHKIADFTKWKASFEASDSFKLANGIHNYVLGRSVDDSNMIMVATKADDIEKAKAFVKNPGLKAAMQKSGVIGAPTIMVNTVVYQDEDPNMSNLRTMNTFKVKDWDAWKTSFESGKQVRTENGLTDRAFGYDADDKHKVTLVLAINDTAKANAFWKGDVVKQRRAESGVVGEVKMRVYRVVHKY